MVSNPAGRGSQHVSAGLQCSGPEEHPGPDPLLLPISHESGKDRSALLLSALLSTQDRSHSTFGNWPFLMMRLFDIQLEGERACSDSVDACLGFHLSIQSSKHNVPQSQNSPNYGILLIKNSFDLSYYFITFVVCVAVPGHPSRHDSDPLCSAARGSEEGHVTQPQTIRLAAG